MFNEYHDVVTVKEMCGMLRIGRNKAYELLAQQKIPAIHMGRKLLVPKYEIIKFIEKESA